MKSTFAILALVAAATASPVRRDVDWTEKYATKE